MRHFPIALVAASALALSACGASDESENQAIDEVDPNIMFEQLGNDASALEAAGQADPLAPAPEDGADSGDDPSSSEAPTSNGSEAPVLGETSGGDTGGNVAQGNSTGQ